MTGIFDLSEKAFALEKAAKENDVNYILNNHENMIRDYGSITADIREQLMEDEGIAEQDVFEFAPDSMGGDKV